MKTAQSNCPRPDRLRLSSVLADRPSRHLLCCLQDGPVTHRDMAVTLAATVIDCAPPAVTDAELERYHRRLTDRYLPRLTDLELLDRSSDGSVRYVPGALDRFEVSVPPLDEPDNPSWTAAAAALGRAYRYRLVELVAERESVSLFELADQLADTDCESPATPRALAIALHHTDLPKLAAADLVTYDAADRTVTNTARTRAVL